MPITPTIGRAGRRSPPGSAERAIRRHRHDRRDRPLDAAGTSASRHRADVALVGQADRLDRDDQLIPGCAPSTQTGPAAGVDLVSPRIFM